MDRLRSISQSLTAAAEILDRTAGEIQDSAIELAPKHIANIGRALAEIYEIQHAIFAMQPDLKPEWLNDRSTSPENRALTEAMGNAIEFERGGNVPSAISELERFLSSATSELHRSIAQSEIARLKGQRET